MAINTIATVLWTAVASLGGTAKSAIVNVCGAVAGAAAKAWSQFQAGTSDLYPVQVYYVNGGTQIVGLFISSTRTNATLRKFNVSDPTTVIATYALPHYAEEFIALDGDDLYMGCYDSYAMRFNWNTWTLIAAFNPGLMYLQRPTAMPGYAYVIYGGSYYTGVNYYTKSNNTMARIGSSTGATCYPCFSPAAVWCPQYYYASGYLYKCTLGNPPALSATIALPWGNGVFCSLAYDSVHDKLWVMSVSNASYRTVYKINVTTNAIEGTYSIPVNGSHVTFIAATQTLEWMYTDGVNPPHLFSFDTNTQITTDKGAITTDLMNPSAPPNWGQEATYPRLYAGGNANVAGGNTNLKNTVYKYS